MPLIKGDSDEVVSENIRTLKAEGKSEEQATAIALSEQRRAKRPKGSGPGTDDSLTDHYHENQGAGAFIRDMRRKIANPRYQKDVDLPAPRGAVKKTQGAVKKISSAMSRLRGES